MCIYELELLLCVMSISRITVVFTCHVSFYQNETYYFGMLCKPRTSLLKADLGSIDLKDSHLASIRKRNQNKTGLIC